MKHILTIILLIATNSIQAQECGCKKNLQDITTAIEKNYGGFEDKVNVKTRSKYATLLQNLKKEATAANDEKTCYAILKKYVAFYQDGHLQLEQLAVSFQENIRYQVLPAENMDSYFQNIDATKDIRGIYTLENYEMAIVPHATNKNSFVAIVISSKKENWKKGMIKMELTPQKNNYYKVAFLYGDFEKIETEAYFSGNVLDVFRVGSFEKKLQKHQQANFINKYISVYPTENISFNFSNEKIAVITIQSFAFEYEKEIDSLINSNKLELEKRPNWILDIRENGGGSTSAYTSILPYLYTNPIKKDGSFYRLSTGHVANFSRLLEANPLLPSNVKNAVETIVKNGKEKPNTWFYKQAPMVVYDSVRINPKKVIILTSKNTASSAEIFLMDAKQSKKVTIIGSYTAGVVDYGDGTLFEIGCNKIKINIPSRKSEYLKYQSFDNKGVKPNIVCHPKDAMQIALKNFK